MAIVDGGVGFERPLQGAAQALHLNAAVARLREGLGGANDGPRHATIALRKSAGMSVIVMAFESGAILRDHVAQAPITVTVLEGSMRFRVAGDEVVLSAGEMVACNPGVHHAVEALGPLALVVHIGAAASVTPAN